MEVFIMNFEGKVAIATGAASGMGLLFSQNFASLGGNVVMSDVDEQRLMEQVQQINAKKQGKAIGVLCDVREYSQVCHVRDVAVESFGKIDVMANFAGGTATRMMKVDTKQYPEFPDVPIDVFDWGIDVNLKGPYYFARAVCPQMVKQHSGVIINLGSVTGAEGSPSGMAYPSAKAGIMTGLTKSIAQFGFDHNIRCVCVSPGPVMTRPAMANMKTGLGRAAETQEVVDFIMYLTSEKAAAITGSNHFIDCGRETLPHR
jgi:3-oxoacyl-[acyl-carrier protein] reductase